MTIITRRQVIAAAAENLGALGRAHDDEPVFVLRARDPSARAVVRDWIARAVAISVDPAKIDEAREVEAAIAEWNQRYGTRVPD